MIKVTWEWLGMAPALDLANTVTIEDGAEHDLIADPIEYARWAAVESSFLTEASGPLLDKERLAILELRAVVRNVIAEVSSAGLPASADLDVLNRISATAPVWVELDIASMTLEERWSCRIIDRVLARYARSALEIVAGTSELRRCPAPSCGMFYLSTRREQRWCSPQCGTRARVGRHYRTHRSVSTP